MPKNDSTLIPWDPDFKVQLGFLDFKAFTLMCARIEYPENAVPKPAAFAAEIFPFIGEFYDAIRDAFVAKLRVPRMTKMEVVCARLQVIPLSL